MKSVDEDHDANHKNQGSHNFSQDLSLRPANVQKLMNYRFTTPNLNSLTPKHGNGSKENVSNFSLE